jgi:hypothetical protein
MPFLQGMLLWILIAGITLYIICIFVC